MGDGRGIVEDEHNLWQTALAGTVKASRGGQKFTAKEEAFLAQVKHMGGEEAWASMMSGGPQVDRDAGSSYRGGLGNDLDMSNAVKPAGETGIQGALAGVTNKNPSALAKLRRKKKEKTKYSTLLEDVHDDD